MKERNLELLLDISNTVSSLLNRESINRFIGKTLSRMFKFDFARIVTYDRQQKETHLFLLYDPQHIFSDDIVRKYSRMAIPVKETPVPEWLIAPKIEFIEYSELIERFPNHPTFRLFYELGIRSSVAVPLIVESLAIGLLILHSRQSHFFQDIDTELLASIATQMAIGVRNILIREDLEASEREKALRLAVNNAVISTTNREALFTATAVETCKFINFDLFTAAVLTDSNALPYSFIAHKSAMSNIERQQDPSLVSCAGESELWAMAPSSGLYVGDSFAKMTTISVFFRLLHQQDIQSVIRVPISVHNGLKVVLCLSSKESYAFTESDLMLLQGVAIQVGLAMNSLFAFEALESMRQQLEGEKNYLQDELKTAFNFDEIFGSSPALDKVFVRVRRVADTDTTVLIEGETGTGKELIARAIHNLSPHKERALVKVNCAALPAQLIESELFGHEKGSFTGATGRRIGKFELANGSSIFLDEIGELSLELQAKLLRVLQEKEFERIGGNVVIKTTARIIAATNRNLKAEVAAGRFRSDLYYRLNTFPITLPPLRDRKEDIPILAMYFVGKFSKRLRRLTRGISDDMMKRLIAYDWPGNVRELEHLIEEAVLISDGETLEIGGSFGGHLSIISGGSLPNAAMSTGSKTLANLEYDRIVEVMRKTHGGIRGPGGAAAILGLKPTTLEARLKKLGIDRNAFFKKS
jgi:formate hydrogenlyase transcriptional activator